jgi:hypothetical protein
MSVPSARRLVSDSDIGFSALFKIYAEAIPPNECKSRDELAAMLRSPHYCFLVFEDKAVVLGFSITYLPKTETFALLEYMAVAKAQRSRGLGSTLFQLALSSEFLPARHEVVIVEIDSPSERSAHDVSIRARRLEFYERNGCFLVPNLKYLFPLVCEKPAPEMNLLIHFRGQRRPILKTEFRQWLQSIYEEVYAMTAGDPRINKMLSQVCDPVL